jgi:hypothetical protein
MKIPTFLERMESAFDDVSQEDKSAHFAQPVREGRSEPRDPRDVKLERMERFPWFKMLDGELLTRKPPNRSLSESLAAQDRQSVA